MKSNSVLSLLCIAWLCGTTSQTYAQYDHCVSVYQAATRNLQISEASYSSLNTIFDDYCEASGEVKTSNSSASIEAVIKQLPISFSGQSASSVQRMTNFCKSYSNVRFESAASRSLSDLVVVDALKAFNECTEITQAGVRVKHSAPTGLEGTFSFQFSSALKYELQGVQTGRNINCTMQKPEGGGIVQLDKTSFYKLERNFSAFCNRQAIVNESDGRQTYPRTSVTFASNHGSYSVIYPEEEVESIQFASMIDRRLSDVETRIGEMARTVSNNYNSTMEHINNRADKAASDLSDFRDRLNVKIYKVMRGEHHRYAHPNWVTVGCGNISDWLHSQCPNQTITQTQVHSQSGNACGYTYVVAACMTK